MFNINVVQSCWNFSQLKENDLEFYFCWILNIELVGKLKLPKIIGHLRNIKINFWDSAAFNFLNDLHPIIFSWKTFFKVSDWTNHSFGILQFLHFWQKFRPKKVHSILFCCILISVFLNFSDQNFGSETDVVGILR